VIPDTAFNVKLIHYRESVPLDMAFAYCYGGIHRSYKIVSNPSDPERANIISSEVICNGESGDLLDECGGLG